MATVSLSSSPIKIILVIVAISVIYLGSTMACGTASVCLTVVALNLHHRGSHRPVPRWARIVFLYHGARWFGLPPVVETPLVRRRVASRPNNYSKCETEPESAEMVEIQNILANPEGRHSANATSGATCIHGVTDNVLLAEAIQYHKVEIPFHKLDTSGSVAVTPSCSNTVTTSNRATKEEVIKQKQDEVIREWQLLARVMDRVFFCLVSLTMLLCALLILLSPWYLGEKKGRDPELTQ